MSGEGIFARHEVDNSAAEEGQLIPDHASINLRRQSGDNSIYKTGAVNHGLSGTVLPVTNNAGSIQTSRDKYGMVNRGQSYTINNAGTEISLGDAPIFSDFSLRKPKEDLLGEQADQEDQEEEEEEEEEPGEFYEHVLPDLDDLDKLVSQIEKSREEPEDFVQDRPSRPKAIEEQPVAKKKAVPAINVKMSGAFGTFKGKFINVTETEDLVVLEYRLDKDIYSPPASLDPFALSYNNIKHTVAYVGIEFELPRYGIGIQVLAKRNIE